MPEGRDQQLATELADEMAKRRGRRYPAHAYIAEKFPDYAKVLTYGVTFMLEAIEELKQEIE
jgi:hypothetical protein